VGYQSPLLELSDPNQLLEVIDGTEVLQRFLPGGELHAKVEKLNTLNVVDAENRPVGYLRLRNLLLSPKDAPARDMMSTDFMAVGPDTDQEVTALADHFELSMVSVVARDGRLIGARPWNLVESVLFRAVQLGVSGL
jgi:Mg/Co/Ni transporter MgtE